MRGPTVTVNIGLLRNFQDLAACAFSSLALSCISRSLPTSTRVSTRLLQPIYRHLTRILDNYRLLPRSLYF
jgi:hypothetical protein